jgi:hypothetical protein
MGVSPTASEQELRAAYRRLVQLHHPDHNGGSPDSARRFEEVQEAYARIIQLRRAEPRGAEPRDAEPRVADHQAAGDSHPGRDPDVEARLADLERQVREAHEARERALRAARQAAAQTEGRATDEELGYITTQDSFSRVLADALDDLAARLKGTTEAGGAPGEND